MYIKKIVASTTLRLPPIVKNEPILFLVTQEEVPNINDAYFFITDKPDGSTIKHYLAQSTVDYYKEHYAQNPITREKEWTIHHSKNRTFSLNVAPKPPAQASIQVVRPRPIAQTPPASLPSVSARQPQRTPPRTQSQTPPARLPSVVRQPQTQTNRGYIRTDPKVEEFIAEYRRKNPLREVEQLWARRKRLGYSMI